MMGTTCCRGAILTTPPLTTPPLTAQVCIFLTTARLTQLYAELFNGLGVSGVLEIHSRKSQPQRTRVAERFRAASRMLLFTSDVSARGMDYPDVTAVVQVGLPSDKAQYVHRLGRTARAGKAGGGHLLLADFERFFLNSLRDLPVQTRPPLGAAEGAHRYAHNLCRARIFFG